MSRRTRIATLSLVCGLAAAAPAPAQAPPDGARPAPAPTVTQVERRLAELEQRLTQMVTDVQAVRRDLKAVAARADGKPEIKVYQLKNASAATLAQLLQQLVNVRLVADDRTNSLIVSGGADHLSLVEALVERLDQPAAKPPGDGGARRDDIDQLRQELDAVRRRLAAVVERWAAPLQSDLDVRKDRLAWMERMAEKGFVSKSQLDQERRGLKEAEEMIEAWRQELKHLAAPPARPADQPRP